MIPGPETAYVVAGVAVRVESDEAVAGWARSVFESQGHSVRGSSDPVVVRVRVVEALPSPRGVEVSTFVPGTSLWKDGDARTVAGPNVASVLDLAAGTVDVLVRRARLGEAGLEVQAHLVVSLSVLLRDRGLFALHAAALTSDAGGLLVVGPSDVGKSTLSYNLVRAGWRFVSDDSVALGRSERGVEARSLRRAFGLDADAAERFPEIEAHARPQMGEPDKWSVDVAALHPQREAEVCLPRLVVFPTITDAPVSSVEPLPVGDAFVQLVGQSPLRDADDGRVADHHALLADLLRQARPALLRAGTDLLDSDVAGRVLSDALFQLPPR
ncbi:hypothetical protein [Rubrivirga sp.]|uniref:hypothetical protein n=1 Tax=Rubrivirga sp. TaxID=1885344 RepID=UPI003B51F093